MADVTGRPPTLNPMKIHLFVPALLLFSLFPGRTAAVDQFPEREPLTPGQIEELVSPIALYPDPLVALILPAATFPSDIVLAARFLDRGGSPERAGTEPWDDSVRALTRYREVIDYLDENLAWTRSLGLCFLDQRDALMDAIQMVRVRAKTAGLLRDSSEQHVIVETEEIRIVPAQPTIIYVPRYDPWVICRPSIPAYHRGPFITFGVGWRIGTWLNLDCDWRSRVVRVVHRPPHWYHRPDWHDRDRYRHFSGTHWTRRTPYPRHDNRFDRSPRSAGFDARGRDHRDWSDRNRSDDRSRHDTRPDHDRYADNSHGNRSPGREDRRRMDMPRRQPDGIDRSVVPAAPVGVPAVGRHSRPDARPDAGIHARIERYRSPDHSRNEHRSPPSVRTVTPRPEPAARPEVAHRSQPASQPPPPVRRVEAQDRAEERRQSDGSDHRSSFRAASGRESLRDNGLR